MRENACGVWGTRGGLLLDDVTIGSLPVLRGTNGRLYFAPHRADGTREITRIAAPRFWSAQPLANIYTRHCAAHGYRAEGAHNEFFAFEPQGSGICRHEFWKNTEPDGTVTGTVMTSISQRHQP